MHCQKHIVKVIKYTPARSISQTQSPRWPWLVSIAHAPVVQRVVWVDYCSWCLSCLPPQCCIGLCYSHPHWNYHFTCMTMLSDTNWWRNVGICVKLIILFSPQICFAATKCYFRRWHFYHFRHNHRLRGVTEHPFFSSTSFFFSVGLDWISVAVGL